MFEKSVLDAVFTMARLGLTEIAKDHRNGPAVIANQAALLEQWRAEMERQMAETKDVAP